MIKISSPASGGILSPRDRSFDEVSCEQKESRMEKSINQSSNIPVMTLTDAFEAIKSVGRGESAPPAWAGKKVYIGEAAKRHWEGLETKSEGLDSFSKLYSDNKDLIAAIAKLNPESIAALAKLVDREESNVSRTLGKLEKFGIVELVASAKGRTKRPTLVMEKVRFDLDLLTGKMSLAGVRRTARL